MEKLTFEAHIDFRGSVRLNYKQYGLCRRSAEFSKSEVFYLWQVPIDMQAYDRIFQSITAPEALFSGAKKKYVVIQA